MSAAGEDEEVSIGDDRNQLEEGEGEENNGNMPNRYQEEEDDVEEENVEVVDVDEEEEENVEVIDLDEEEGQGEGEAYGEQYEEEDDREEEKVDIGYGEEELKGDLVVVGEEENVDDDVDIDDDDEPPQPSISVLGTNDPFPPASNSGVFHTAAAARSSTHLNSPTVEDAAPLELLRSSSHDPRATFGVSPRGMPNRTHLNSPTLDDAAPLEPLRFSSRDPRSTFGVSPRGMQIPLVEIRTLPRGDDTSLAEDVEGTPESRAGRVSPTVQIVSGADVFEVTTTAGVQFISSKMLVDASTTKDTSKPEIEQVADLAFENEALPDHLIDQRSKSSEPPNHTDDKSSDFILRKNSIQDSNPNLRTGMQNAPGNLSSQPAPVLKQSELINETTEAVIRASGKRDHLMSDAGRAAHELDDKSAAKRFEQLRNTENDDPSAFAGLNALTSAIDIGNARDALAQLQPELDNGTDGGETDAGGSNFEQREKTELEREMELFEAAEREEEARLLASMRSDQSMHGGIDSGKDALNDRKRASETIPNEARKKRGKRAVANDDQPKEEEDVCFICFDGGELVLCDRRTCPKAYHLNCIGRDAAFFQKKGAWICGWHFCSICTKPANFQCYTCPTAYCSGCLDQADFLCVRQRKGLCEECWPIVSMIENKETVGDGVEVDFTDQETYEGLFKEYWEDLKQRLQITQEELDKGGKGGNAVFLALEDSDGEEKVDGEDYGTESGNEVEEEEQEEEEEEMVEVAKKRKRRRGKKGQYAGDAEADFGSENEDEDGMAIGEEDADDKPSQQPREFDGWASKELIEFVKFMDEEPKKPLSRFQVTKLLWSYIKSQKLQDPRKKTQILCDDRLKTIFGKKTVGQFEMFKHLQSHFAPKSGRRGGRQMREEPVTLEDEGMDVEGAVDEKHSRVKDIKDIKDKRRKRKAEEEKFERPNVDEFAAVTPKNIGLIYLRRQLLEELLDDPEFDSKVCNTFVRIRVPGMISKSEMCYRLVQVVGTRLQAEHYKAGRKITNYVLEILNLQKREDVTVDLVSNHDFNEEECQRLRQSIKCGFIKTLTVGDIEEKAKALQEAKVNDWFETERQRLVNLRDRASEKGRKKELRECVEKLQELNSPAFRAAKLHARPEVTADPRMDPDYESDGTDDKATDGMSNKFDNNSSFGDKMHPVSILKGSHNESSRADWDGQKSKQPSWADTTYRSKEGDRLYDSIRTSDKLSFGRPAPSYGVEGAKEKGYEERERNWGMEQQSDATAEAGWMGNGRNRAAPAQKWNEKVDLSINVDSRITRPDYRAIPGMTTPVFDTKPDWQARREPAPSVGTGNAAAVVPQGFSVPAQNVMTQAALEAQEKEKLWHYVDPTGMVQGPFAMEQLRKWNTMGYFPEDLRVWKTNEPRDEAIVLTAALAGRFQKERESWGSGTRAGNPAVGNPVVASIQEDLAQALTTSATVPFTGSQPAVKSDGWRDNGGASGWTERGGSGDLARSASWGVAVNQNNRPFARDVASGTGGPVRDNSIDMKWKPGPAGGAFDSYGRSGYSNSATRSGRADAAAKFDPANWVSRPASGRERDGWGASPTVLNESGGYSNLGERSSLGRGSSYRDPGGKWNPNDSSGQESSRSRSATRAARKDIPCRFHQKGYCKRGDSCDFWHG